MIIDCRWIIATYLKLLRKFIILPKVNTMITKIIVFGITLVGLSSTQLYAQGEGMFLGAVGGALIGQAVGRDTRSTLIGTGVGAIIGSTIDIDDRPRYEPRYEPRHIRPAYYQREEWVRIDDDRPTYRPAYQPVVVYRDDEHPRDRGHRDHRRHERYRDENEDRRDDRRYDRR